VGYWGRLGVLIGALTFSVGALAGQQAQDPEHPFPNHEPPDDYRCVAARDAKAVKTDVHACSCLGMMLEPMCPETDDEMEARINSSACKAWCKPKQCMCAAQCLDSRVQPWPAPVDALSG
jgi:hypothetical protein